MTQKAGILPYQEAKKRSPMDAVISAVAMLQYVACGAMVLGVVWEMGLPYRLSQAQADASRVIGKVQAACFLVSWATAVLLFALARKSHRGTCAAAIALACFATIMPAFSIRPHSWPVVPPPAATPGSRSGVGVLPPRSAAV